MFTFVFLRPKAALIYFVRSGYVTPNGSYLYSAGIVGYYWSSAPYPSGANAAYSLHFNNTGVNPSGNYSRYLGFSLRCLAR